MLARFQLRELADPLEYHACVDVAKAAWRFSERLLSPASDLIAATHAGGLTAGAFDGKRLVGFVHGIPRTNVGQPCQHSHLLAVRPEVQGLGLSILLKRLQRTWCLERGIRLVTWTFDPFLVKNARLNIERLGAAATRLLPNFYGPMGGIYGLIPSDRFEVRWRLDAPHVVRLSRGEPAPPPDPTEKLPLATARTLPDAPRVSVPFPAGAPAIYRADPEGTTRARKRFDRIASALFGRGYEATAVSLAGKGPSYVFERVGAAPSVGSGLE